MQVSQADSRPVETRNLPEPEQSVESMEPSSHQAHTSRDKVSSSVSQLLLTESIVEEVPLCMPPPQLQSEQHIIEFGGDVEELFNGAEDTDDNWWDLVN